LKKMGVGDDGGRSSECRRRSKVLQVGGEVGMELGEKW
jgi:hypothetical protein